MNADSSGSTELRDANAWRAARAQYRETLLPEALEATLLARFGELHAGNASVEKVPAPVTKRRWPNWLGWPSWTVSPRLVGGVACAFVASVAALWWQFASTPGVATTPFMLVSEPSGQAVNVAQLVRVNVSREAMLDFGIPVPPQQLEDEVRAEMLLGQRGEVIAVRFIEKPERKRSSSTDFYDWQRRNCRAKFNRRLS